MRQWHVAWDWTTVNTRFFSFFLFLGGGDIYLWDENKKLLIFLHSNDCSIHFSTITKYDGLKRKVFFVFVVCLLRLNVMLARSNEIIFSFFLFHFSHLCISSLKHQTFTHSSIHAAHSHFGFPISHTQRVKISIYHDLKGVERYLNLMKFIN